MLKKVSAVVICFLYILMMTISPIQAKTNNNTKQNFANVVIFAYFNDDTSNYFADEANVKTIMEYYEGTSKRSFKNYMNEISYGQFEVHNIFPQYNGTTIDAYEIKNTTSQVASTSNVDYAIISEILANVPGVTDKTVDYNGDGYIDNLTIVLNGAATSTGTTIPSLYPHKNTYPASTTLWGNSYVSIYNILNTDRLKSDQSSLIAHEFLHSLGYPDLYTPNVNEKPVGVWDIMAESYKSIAYPLAYLRAYFSNWISIDTISATQQNITLHTQSNKDGNQAVILKSPYSNYEFFVVEMRKKGDYYDSDSYDARITDSGIIVYRVDTTVSGLSNYNGKTGIYVFRPNGDNASIRDAYLSLESGRTTIGKSDVSATLEQGALTFSDGTNSGIVISNVSSSAGDSMTFDVTIPTASIYDIWEDTNYDGGSYGTDVSMVEYQGKQYVVSINKDNGTIISKAYDGTSWSQFATDISITGIVDQINIFEDNGEFYLTYSKGNSQGYYDLIIKKYDGTSSWIDLTEMNNIQECDIDFYNGNIYIAYTNIDGKANLLQIDQSGVKTLIGEYFSSLCGTPKVTVMNNTIYVSVRSSASQLYFYAYQPTTKATFTPIVEGQTAKSYDVATDGKNIYVAAGTSNGMQMSVYDGTNWTVKQEQSINNFSPEIAFAQGNIYVLVSSSDGNRNLNVYEYKASDNSYTSEGILVGRNASKYTLSASNQYLYVSYIEDNKVTVKKKNSSNELLSLTITPPNKISYIKGDPVDTTGLVVTANYRIDTRTLNSGDYTISNFDTSVAGTRQAVISFGGKTNTFTYTVSEKAITLTGIKVEAVTSEYEVGSNLEVGDIKVIAEYDNGTTKELALSDVTVNNFVTDKAGDYTATVEYNGKTASFVYKVVEKQVVDTEEPGKVEEIVSEDSSVIMNGSFTEGTTLSVNISEEDITLDALPIGYKMAQLWDLQLYYNGQSINLDGNTIVKINLPVELQAKSLLMARLLDDGTYTLIDATVENGVISFETNTVGKFVILVEEDTTSNTPQEPQEPDTPQEPQVPDTPDTPQEPQVPDTPGTPQEPQVPDTPDTPQEPQEPDTPDTPNNSVNSGDTNTSNDSDVNTSEDNKGNSENVITGDSTQIWIYIVLVIVALIGGIGAIIWKKKDK